MSATIASAPLVAPRTATSQFPIVEREDIVFHSPRAGQLLVEVTFRNPGVERTQATFGLLRSAPLGVFVPWQDLGFVQVPAIEPGKSIVVRNEYEYESPEPLGSIDKLPPERVLTALGSDEPARRRRRPRPSNDPQLATDLLALMSTGSLHWAGNLNVFFPGVDVERHVARDLRVYPGRMNLVDFIVGNPADLYQFHLDANPIDWNFRLFDTSIGKPILAEISTGGLALDRWLRPACGVILLSVEPPRDAESGAVNVHIRQKSTGREAVVEFTMDSRAAGPGCYRL